MQHAEKSLLKLFLIWRCGLFLVGFLAERFLAYRPEVEYTRLAYFFRDPWLKNWWGSTLSAWANFDGVHYILIALRGYDFEARFFPAYPLALRGFFSLTGVSSSWVHAELIATGLGLLISNLAFAAALIVLYRLLRLDFSEKIVRLSCLFLILFPTSFFFVSVYSESLLLLLVISSFWLARKGWWGGAALCAALATATRMVGIFLLPALIIEYAISIGWRWKNIRLDALYLLLAPSGLLLFSFFNQVKFGKWNTFLLDQASLGNSRNITGIVDPVRVFVRYIRILATVSTHQYEWWVAVLELASYVLGLALLYWLWRWRKKIRSSYIIYMLGCFFLPVLSGTLTGLPRYILVIFPFFVTLAHVFTEKKRLVVIIMLGLQILLTMLFLRGYLIA